MSQDYILLDPQQYYDNNMATDITKYSRKEHAKYNNPPKIPNNDVAVDNTLGLLDIINLCAKNLSESQNQLEVEVKYVKKLKYTIVTLTILIIFILVLYFISVLYLKNCRKN